LIDPGGRDAVRAWLDSGAPLELKVLSGSMWPSIRPGDIVRAAPLSGRPRLGDIVLIEMAGRRVVHRIRGLGATLAATKGDSSTALDPPVSNNSVVARIEAVKRGTRWYVLPPYPLSLIAAALSIVAASSYAHLRPAIAFLRSATGSDNP
jgi:signal peptidase I